MTDKMFPLNANAELYSRLLKDEYIEFLTLEIVFLLKGKINARTIKTVENKLIKDFYKDLDEAGILKRVLQKAKLIQ